MFYYVLLLSIVILSIAFLVILSNFYKLIRIHLRICSGYVLDEKVDNIVQKATILGELYSRDQKKTGREKIDFAYEKSMSIISDVMLQNGINPREYHLPGLVMVQRLTLGLNLTPAGGEKNG